MISTVKSTVGKLVPSQFSIVPSNEQISTEIMANRFVGLLYCRTNSNIVACFGVITHVTMFSNSIDFATSSPSFVCCLSSDHVMQLPLKITSFKFKHSHVEMNE